MRQLHVVPGSQLNQVNFHDIFNHVNLPKREPCEQNSVITHSELMAQSLRHWTGRELINGTRAGFALAHSIWRAPFVVVSHGTQSDPILNYGNRAALVLWELSWEELTHMPSRLTAETPERAERERLLARVTQYGFIDNYSGVRISKSGRRFRITGATVWNLRSERNEVCGQAAMFDRWEFI